MFFELSITIERSPSDVFAFLRDKHLFPQEPDSPVLRLDKITPGPVGIGTEYVEVVQMLPLVKGVIQSRITKFEQLTFLEEDFTGSGMVGHLAYEFISKGKHTLLIQRETLQWRGMLKFLSPLISPMLGNRLRLRLSDIKSILEAGWIVNNNHYVT